MILSNKEFEQKLQKKAKEESAKTLKILLEKQEKFKEMEDTLSESQNSIAKRLCYSNLAVEFPNLKQEAKVVEQIKRLGEFKGIIVKKDVALTGPVLQGKKIKFGQFVNQKLEGAGIEIDEFGNYFLGAWVNDKRNGKGRKIFGAGGYLEGEFVEDIKQGKGVYIWADG